MEKVKKSYVEKIYRGILFSESSISEVEERDPMKVENDGSMQGFRFYDKEFVVDGEKSYDGEKSNYSNWIYYGKRLSLDEVKTQYGNNPNYRILISNMEGNGYQYVCHTQAGSFLPMQEGDMTFDELVAQKEQQDRARAEARQKSAIEAKKAKYTLMGEGLTLVKPETVEEWLQFVDDNSDDIYSLYVVKATISMMKKMKEGISFEEAEQCIIVNDVRQNL